MLVVNGIAERKSPKKLNSIELKLAHDLLMHCDGYSFEFSLPLGVVDKCR